MRRILLFLFILFFTGEIYSRDYVNYNIKVLGAQMLLLKDDIDSALIIYKQAFELVDKPFPKDLLNAAFAAYYADSLYLMKHCITSAIEVGAYFKFVKKKFKNKYKNKDFWTTLEKEYLLIVQKKETDTLFNTIKKMFDEDQKARKGIFNKKRKMIVADSSNAIKINKIVSEYYYPGFITLGTYNSLVMTHWFFLHFPVPNYKNIILNGLRSGEITPMMATFMYQRQFMFQNNGSCPINFPDLILKTYRSYVGERYQKLQKQGFDFNYHL